MRSGKLRTGEIVVAALALIAVVFLAFLNLSGLPIRLWDESRLGISAFEMYRDGFSLIVNFNGEPDLWSTKPPLLIWIQAALMHVTGPGELPVRIPSAAAVSLTCVGLIYLTRKLGLSAYPGAIAALVLVTVRGFNEAHSGRTGDYEALLALFTTLSVWGFYFAVKTEFKTRKWIYFFFAMLTLGFMVKSIAALLFAPAMLIWLLWQKQLSAALRSKHTYIGAVAMIAVLATYHLLRENASPGYLSAIWVNDLFGRYGSTIEAHRHGFMYYFENFIESKSKPYTYTTIAGMVVVFLQRDRELRNLGLFSALMFLGYILVISNSSNKLYWYDNPVYPFAAMLSAIFLWQLALWAMALIGKKYKVEYYKTVAWVLVVAAGILPNYIYMISRHANANEAPEYYSEYHVTYMLRSMYNDWPIPRRDITGYTVVYDQYDAQNFFYHKLLDHSGRVVYRKHINDVIAGDTVIIWSDYARNQLLTNFNTELLWEEDNSRTQAFYVIPKDL